MITEPSFGQIFESIGSAVDTDRPALIHGAGFIIGIATMARGGTVVSLPGHGFEAEAAVKACQDLECDYCVIGRRCLCQAAAQGA